MDTGRRGHPCRPARSGLKLLDNLSQKTYTPPDTQRAIALAWLSQPAAGAALKIQPRILQETALKMSESNIVLPTLTSGQVMILWMVLVSALVALAYGVVLIRVVLAAYPGPNSMTDVSDAIELGAMAYLGRQVKTMIWFVAAIFIALFFMYRNVYQGLYLPLGISIAFLMGVAASYGAGYVGMWLAVKGNVRSANAALTSFKDAMELAFKAGGVSGM